MSRYQVFLSDEASTVRRVIGLVCNTDQQAISVATRFVREGGRVDFCGGWSREDPIVLPVFDNLDPLHAALVKRVWDGDGRSGRDDPPPFRSAQDRTLARILLRPVGGH